MKIMIVSLNHAPEPTGIGKYVGEMVEWLDARGAEVRVVTAPPYYPAWRISAGHSGLRYRTESSGRTHVTRCPVYVPARPTGARRVAHLASFALSSAPVLVRDARRWRPDVIMAIEPPLACAPFALAAARASGARSWLHVQDFEVDAAFSLGLLGGGATRRIALAAERRILRAFDRVTTISGAMDARLQTKGVPASRRAIFPNWVDATAIRPLDVGGRLGTELGFTPGVRVALYSGNLGQKQGLDVLLEAARLLPAGGPVQVVICGDGADRERLMAIGAGVPQVRFIPLQPTGRLNELLNVADVHILPQRAEAEDLVMPSKLAAMMASGRPVVATARPESEVGVAVARGGVLVAPGDAAALAAAILDLCRDDDRRRRLGRAAREYACAQWDKTAVLERAFGGEAALLSAAPSDSAAGGPERTRRVVGVTQP